MLVKPIADVQARIRTIRFAHPWDLIVAIARGGIVPATMIQAHWGGQLEWLWLHFRADDQTPVRPEPELIRPLGFDPAGRSILIVDDRSATGKTLDRARALLSSASQIQTLVVNGRADYSLFDDDCFYFPWRMDIPEGTESEPIPQGDRL